MNWTLGPGGAADAESCYAIYVDAVRNGTTPLYTAAQAMAWAPTDTVEDWMPSRLENGTTWIANLSGRAVGFLTVTKAGHLDLFFVRPEFRRTGLSTALYDQMMDWAGEHGIGRLTTFASHLARRFLERRGWHMIDGETVLRNGVELERWKMEIDLVNR